MSSNHSLSLDTEVRAPCLPATLRIQNPELNPELNSELDSELNEFYTETDRQIFIHTYIIYIYKD